MAHVSPGTARRRTALAVSATLLAAGVVAGTAATPAAARQAPARGAAAAHHPAPAAYRVTSAPLTGGLYQSAYSARNDALWVTAVADEGHAGLLKVDPDTLKVRRTIVPPADPVTGARQLAFGVAVDDRNNTVWTTDTIADTVSVYDQRTGKELTTLRGVGHAREIAVDQLRDRAYVTAVTGGDVVVYDTRTLKEVRRVHVEGANPTAVTVDPRTGTAYATDLNGHRLIVVPARASAAPSFIPVDSANLLDVALDPSGRTAYAADLDGGRLIVVDLRTGATKRSVATGAGTISVSVDGRSGLAYVSAQSGTTEVVDPVSGRVLRTLPTGAHTNHVTWTPKGVYVVEKATQWGTQGTDSLFRITATRR